MRLKAAIIAVLIVLAQYKAWFSDVGYFTARTLERQVEEQQQRTAELRHDNAQLLAEVVALKNGLAAVEARARNDLGMVGENETFYLIPAERW